MGNRGRVVMLVDNAVEGDSRVQKIAQSAAEAGWSVTLLGISPTGGPAPAKPAPPGARSSWRIGQAEVRLLPMAAPRPPAARLRAGLVTRGGWPLRAARLARRPIEYAQVWFWLAVQGDRAWRRLEPGLWHFERVFGPAVDELEPDLIHAHDFRMLGVGARAVRRARAAGRQVKLVWDAHEFLPGIRPRRENARWLPGHRAHEREYAGDADAVLTVSETLADLLCREHRLARRPTVVLNAPAIGCDFRGDQGIGAALRRHRRHQSLDHRGGAPPSLRELCGVDDRTPLLVYGGAAAAQRGLETVVEALPRLPGVHAALVVPDPSAPYPLEVLARAEKLGVADRTHLLPYVPHWQVVGFLGAADAGVIPIHHWPNHEIALITKFFEYSHARLPIVVSDVETMAGMVRATGQGEVFRARDVADFARAARAVLADPGRYRAAYDRPDSPLPGWTWQAQAAVLDEVYSALVPVSSAR